MDLRTGSPGFSAYIIAGSGSIVNHYRKRERMINWCLKKCCHCETSVLKWRGNPPVEWNPVRLPPKIAASSTLSGTIRYISPLSKGIATPVCALVRNDSKYSTNFNLPPRGMAFGRAMQKPRMNPGFSQKRRGKMKKIMKNHLSILYPEVVKKKRG